METTTVGENLPDLVPFVTDGYSRQEVYGARHAFVEKVREAAATFLYGVTAGVLTADEVDDVTYDATEVAKVLLEVEGASLSYDEEVAAEERATSAMRTVHDASVELRYDHCPDCGERFDDEATEVAPGHAGQTTTRQDGPAWTER